MGKSGALLLIVFAGCQPMFGAKSEPLRKPGKVAAGKRPVDTVAAIPYVEECRTNFRGDPTGLSIDRTKSSQLEARGDDALAQSAQVADPDAQARTVVVSINHYRDALTKNPYNPDITLKLALAYDRVYRKGCALKLLARIATLESHPSFRAAARRTIDQVNDSAEYFKHYRQEAIAAIGGLSSSPAPSRP